MKGLRAHPLHLTAIVLGLAGCAVAYWTGQGDSVVVAALGLAFVTAVDLARRLGLEPADDPAAPHNRGQV